jgi:hypothetical protein
LFYSRNEYGLHLTMTGVCEMSEITNAERLMKLKEILHDHTDEYHQLSIKDIVERLKFHFGQRHVVRYNIHNIDENVDKKSLERLIVGESILTSFYFLYLKD